MIKDIKMFRNETPQQARARYISMGYKPCDIGSIGGRAIYFILVGLGLFPFVGIPITLFLLIMGLVRINSKKYYYHSTETHGIYKEDKRYKDGYRQVGSNTIEVEVALPASPEELKVNKKWGKIYLYTALGVGILTSITTPIVIIFA
jgi:hypothetical protein